MYKLLVVLLLAVAFQAVASRSLIVRNHKGRNLKQCIMTNCECYLKACVEDQDCIQTVQNCAQQAKSGDLEG
jgi:hypothetical protein